MGLESLEIFNIIFRVPWILILEGVFNIFNI